MSRQANDGPQARRSSSGFGGMLREWRRARGASQLELALACGVSQRHLSFLETGRSRPSRGMVIHLASVLDVPLHQQNALLLAAGFAPVYRERPLDAPEMRPVDRAIDHMLDRQEPYPAILVNEAYDILRGNRGLAALLGFLLGPATVAAASGPPMNAVEMVLRADGLRPFLENRDEVGAWLIRRLRAEAMLRGNDDKIGAVLDRVLRLPDVAGLDRAGPIDRGFPPTLALRFRKGNIRLSLFSVIATVGTPLDISLQDLRLELFFPGDDETAAWFGRFGPEVSGASVGDVSAGVAGGATADGDPTRQT
jgi:transcriptional regulator with XRE-family HTH domain